MVCLVCLSSGKQEKHRARARAGARARLHFLLLLLLLCVFLVPLANPGISLSALLSSLKRPRLPSSLREHASDRDTSDRAVFRSDVDLRVLSRQLCHRVAHCRRRSFTGLRPVRRRSALFRRIASTAGTGRTTCDGAGHCAACLRPARRRRTRQTRSNRTGPRTSAARQPVRRERLRQPQCRQSRRPGDGGPAELQSSRGAEGRGHGVHLPRRSGFSDGKGGRGATPDDGAGRPRRNVAPVLAERVDLSGARACCSTLAAAPAFTPTPVC